MTTTVGAIFQQLDEMRQAMVDLVAVQQELIHLIQQVSVSKTQSQPFIEKTSALLTESERIQQHIRLQQSLTNHTKLSQEMPFSADEVIAERVSIRERDGTLRLVLCNSQHSPGYVMDGKPFAEQTEQRPAGIYFFNDEGNECGGLVFGGKQHSAESYNAGAGFFFDQYRQDQIVGIMHQDINGKRSAGFYVWDRSDLPLPDWAERCIPVFNMPTGSDKQQALAALREEGLLEATRVFIGKDTNRDACLSLHDIYGNVRLKLVVRADGTPAIECLNEEGELIERFPPIETNRDQ